MFTDKMGIIEQQIPVACMLLFFFNLKQSVKNKDNIGIIERGC